MACTPSEPLMVTVVGPPTHLEQYQSPVPVATHVLPAVSEQDEPPPLIEAIKKLPNVVLVR